MKKFIALLIILVGVGFLALPKITEYFIEKNAEEVKVDTLSEDELLKNAKSGDKNYDPSKIDPIDANGVILNRQKADMSKVVGQIVIPSINKNIAVFDGLENNHLMYGACTMKPNQRMGIGNYAVAGHYMENDKLLFGGLMKVRLGDTIKITNKKNIYEYEVFKTMKVADDRVDLISDAAITSYDGDALLSLMTCYYDESGSRYFVIGKFKKLYPYTQDKMLSGLK